MAGPYPQREYNAGQPTSGYPSPAPFGGAPASSPFGGPDGPSFGPPAGGPFAPPGGPPWSDSAPTPGRRGLALPTGSLGLLLAGALVVAAAALLLALLAGHVTVVAFVSWALAGPGAVGLLAGYSRRDTMERTRPFHIPRPWQAPLYWLTIVVAAAGIAVSAYHLANWAGRL